MCLHGPLGGGRRYRGRSYTGRGLRSKQARVGTYTLCDVSNTRRARRPRTLPFPRGVHGPAHDRQLERGPPAVQRPARVLGGMSMVAGPSLLEISVIPALSACEACQPALPKPTPDGPAVFSRKRGNILGPFHTPTSRRPVGHGI
ncbi:hypothetical protein CALCODRAFT_168385 [Calocera cornea HHB12733]|uniref:Uncharacterized protein n=1 Tax=Calocera cornea HHB12733 TaxID=1353952 RepID=A0A165CHJ8_9BASI|nr:hypothetical protein CALCODRAFT_168385 [Calocera cornea HHB12733]